MALFRELGVEISERKGSRIGVRLFGDRRVFHRPHTSPDTKVILGKYPMRTRFIVLPYLAKGVGAMLLMQRWVRKHGNQKND